MQKSQAGRSDVLVLFLVCVGIVLFIIWGIAKRHGIDYEVLLGSIGKSIVLLVLWMGGLFVWGRSVFSLITSIALLALWPIWWPVLISMGSIQVQDPFGWDESVTKVAWYASAWFRWGLEICIAGIGGYALFGKR